MSLEDIMLSEKDVSCKVPLIGSNQNNHTHRAWRVPGAGGGRKEELLFHGCRASVLQGENILEIGCILKQMNWTYTLKNDYDDKCYIAYILP